MKAGPLATLASTRQVLSDSPRAWGGTNDFAARVYSAWSPAGLSFAAVVADDSLVPGHDALDLFIDGREEWKHFYVEYQPGVLHVRLEPQADGTVRVSTPPYSKTNFYASHKPEAQGVTAAAKITAHGYVLEWFVPWTKANFDADGLEPNTIVRLGLLAHDVDAGRTGEVTLKWYAGRASDYDTSGWQSVATRKGE